MYAAVTSPAERRPPEYAAAGGPTMFAFASLSDQEIFTRTLIAAYLTAAPLLLGSAALLGHLSRRARSAG